ncbi:MAG TPA: hypothetical protein DCY93_02765 [Firmicutes bacterium]|nr:hypothetical protein [Bacillota bacterium]
MKTTKIAYTALFTALAVLLHYIEGLIPVPIPIPGFKLGLANIVGVFALYYLGVQYYVVSNICRVLIVALISTGFGTAFFLSCGGALLSTIMSIVLYKLLKCSVYGTSTVSACFHVLGQILVYILITTTPYMLSYFPILAVLSMVSGFLLAILADILLKSVPSLKQRRGYKKQRDKA